MKAGDTLATLYASKRGLLEAGVSRAGSDNPRAVSFFEKAKVRRQVVRYWGLSRKLLQPRQRLVDLTVGKARFQQLALDRLSVGIDFRPVLPVAVSTSRRICPESDHSDLQKCSPS